MKSKNLSESILRSVKSKGYKYIDLPSVIEANHIVQRSGENFRKFIFSFTDQNLKGVKGENNKTFPKANLIDEVKKLI